MTALSATLNAVVAYSVFVNGFKLRGPKAGARLLSLKNNGRNNLATIEYSIKPGSVQCLLSRIKCEEHKEFPNKTIPCSDFVPDFLEKNSFTISVPQEKAKVELKLSFSKWFHDVSLPIDLSHEQSAEIEKCISHGKEKSPDPKCRQGSNDVIEQTVSEPKH